MKPIQVKASRIIDAPPADVYAVIRDYNVGHQAILPRPPFEEMIVEKGGVGAGTVLRLRLKVYGQVYHYHQAVSEPEPGRVILEEDLNSTQRTRFIFEPVDGGRKTNITIHSEYPPAPGIAGFFQRYMIPAVTRPVYHRELNLLADYLRDQAQASSQPNTAKA